MNTTCLLPGSMIPGFDSSLLIAHQADEHWVAGDGEAHCSIWWNAVPSLPNEKLGVIGHFSAQSEVAGKAVLEEAARRLGEQGCSLAVGPLDGNTWRRYRLVTERGVEPPFFMEPENPDDWPEIFAAAGFEPLAEYSSSLVEDLSRRDPRVARARERLEQSGVVIRQLDPAHYEDELCRIHGISVQSFVHNFLYTELPKDTFLAQYLPYKEKVRAELVLLAEKDSQTVGYLFALPDFREALRGEPIRTVIGKTLAFLPGKAYGGLGLVLTESLHASAQNLGYTRIIHALQYDGNRVRNMSEFFGHIMRRYTLYSRRLA